jgi:hypothetical protein
MCVFALPEGKFIVSRGRTGIRYANYEAQIANPAEQTMNLWKKIFGAEASPEVLFQACSKGDCKKVGKLLKRSPDLVFSKDKNGTTPLSLAASKGYKEMVELLLANKADVNADHDYETPLAAASQGGFAEVVGVLLAAGARVDDGGRRSLYTPLLWACENGHAAVVSLLLQAGANKNFQHLVSNDTPISIASKRGHTEVWTLLFNTPSPRSKRREEVRQPAQPWDVEVMNGTPLSERSRETSGHALDAQFPSIEAELLNAAAQLVPGTWQTLEGWNGDRRFTLRFPPTWLKGSSPEGRAHTLLKPPSARLVEESGKPMMSPCVTVVVAGGQALRDEALLDHWLNTRGYQFQGFRLRESVKTRLHGTRTLAIHHDFARASGVWTCLMVVRVVGSEIWYADASGQTADFLPLRAELISVLASMRIDTKGSSFDPQPSSS